MQSLPLIRPPSTQISTDCALTAATNRPNAQETIIFFIFLIEITSQLMSILNLNPTMLIINSEAFKQISGKSLMRIDATNQKKAPPLNK
jgi:hypothetical protein